jgi:NitT/TauT family transport system ATP-binding protein
LEGSPVIRFDHVAFAFGDTLVMKDFCADFEPHAVNCVLGPSGCGKTTLLNMAAGLLAPTAGAIAAPQTVSYVFQEHRLIPQKTLQANLDFVLRVPYPGKAQRRAVIDTYLALAHLDAARDRYPHELSGGMKRRAALIRAFAYPAAALFMDEPFKGLDIQLHAELMEVFSRLHEQDARTVLFVTHNIEEAVFSADLVHILGHKPLAAARVIDARTERAQNGADGLRALIYEETRKWNKDSGTKGEVSARYANG